jgi:hypothetical protein
MLENKFLACNKQLKILVRKIQKVKLLLERITISFLTKENMITDWNKCIYFHQIIKIKIK